MLLSSLAWSAYLVTVVSEGLTTKSWRMVEGTVISSNGLRIQHNQERYIIEVEYSYMVDEKLFVGNRVSNVNSMLDRAERDLQLKRYQTRDKVNVFYNPQEPSKSYLMVGVGYGIYLSCEFKSVIKKLILKKALSRSRKLIGLGFSSCLWLITANLEVLIYTN